MVEAWLGGVPLASLLAILRASPGGPGLLPALRPALLPQMDAEAWVVLAQPAARHPRLPAAAVRRLYKEQLEVEVEEADLDFATPPPREIRTGGCDVCAHRGGPKTMPIEGSARSAPSRSRPRSPKPTSPLS